MTQNEKQWECMKWNEEGITWEFTLKKKRQWCQGWSGIKVRIILIKRK